MVNWIKSPEDYLKVCAEEGIGILDYGIICEYRGRPVHNGTFFFGHTTSIQDAGWQYDRFNSCWRAPGEDVMPPAGKLSEEEIQRRITNLVAVVPSSVEWNLKIFNDNNEILHEETRTYPYAGIPWSEVGKFNWEVG